MNKTHLTTVAVIVILVAGVAFWGGMTYGQSQVPANSGRTAQGSNFGPPGQGGQRGAGGRFTNGGGAFGKIIAKDATSITVELGGPNATSTNGTNTGSKIVLYDNSTQVGKFVSGSMQDLSIGENVSITGTPNSDGSITAQTIQIRPTGMQRPGGQ